MGDLVYHFPFRYIDYSATSPINLIQPGEVVTVSGLITNTKNEYARRGFKLQKIRIQDQSGEIEAIWFNQPFLINSLRIGQKISLSGRVERFKGKMVLSSPDYETTDKSIHTGRLVPVYHETAGVTSRWLRTKMASLINESDLEIREFLPFPELTELREALRKRHFPNDRREIEEAKKRFAFEEVFLLQLAILKRKKTWQEKKLAWPLKIDKKVIESFIRSLPFPLTKAQLRVIGEITEDLEKTGAMNRLLEGDVGSGKTVVAAGAILAIIKNKLQAGLMVPTEILAQQHYETLNCLLGRFGVRIELITGNMPTRDTLRDDSGRQPDLIIGTQALLYRQNLFRKLGLLVIDEQHRFGVAQRNRLLERAVVPHLLTMTATPIPRSVALTRYGDLEVSRLDEIPPGRPTVKTWVVPAAKRIAAYEWIKKQIQQDGQVFIICPLIEASEKENRQTLKAVKEEFKKLMTVFADYKLALLHGRLKSTEKRATLEAFWQRKFDILVSTPVVEVGIDIPNATVMMIEGAERFGLAQLHQLRGRVGRGTKPAFCLLFTTKDKDIEQQRLKAMEKIRTGSELAEIDLRLRGAGEIYGWQQHGFWGFKSASLTDSALIKRAKKAAAAVWPRLKELPLLKEKVEESKITLVSQN